MREAGETAEISASRREQLGESFRRLPAFLAELEPYMGRLGDLTEAQTPVLRDLESASGELDTFLTRLRPFTAAGLPAFKALGGASVVGRRAVLKTDEEVHELRRLGEGRAWLRQAAAPASPDDRRSQPRLWSRTSARRRAGPPARDKTHTTSSRAGFTGMEAIWNYFYWQTLSTNALDDVGHVLRLTALVQRVHALRGQAGRGDIERCNQFLGPTQPGVTTPDPTRPGGSAATASARGRGIDAAAPADPTNPALDFLLGQ